LAIETGGCGLGNREVGLAGRDLDACQLTVTTWPPESPSKSMPSSPAESSSPISVFNEKAVGNPLKLQLHTAVFPPPPTLGISVGERATSESSRWESRCNEPEPTRTTASTEVRKDKTERI